MTAHQIDQTGAKDCILLQTDPLTRGGADARGDGYQVYRYRDRFVWLDVCNSNGKNPTGNPNNGFMTGQPHYRWPNLFRINTSAGAWVGWNGQSLWAADFSTGQENVWGRWGRRFWEYIGSDHTVEESLDYADRVGQPFSPKWDPWYFDNTLVRSKRIKIGDWRLGE